MPGNILLVDDEEQLRKLLGRIISLEGFTVREAASLKTSLELLGKGEFDILLCDVRLPDGDGVEFVATVKKNFPFIEIILLTAYGNIPDGVRAMKNGAFDYIVKGDDNDRIIPLLHQAVELARNKKEKAIKVHTTGNESFTGIVGKNEKIIQAIGFAERVAPGNSTVLLLGETGSGKEVFAKFIHERSKRKQQPFIAVNCSAFTRELLEGELFGYKEGAYTGATRDKKGLIEVAAGGTLFLDEIGELPAELQAKLLRVLENGEYIKLGDTKISKANVRIIAATNRKLQEEIEKGNFREDLFYRLNVFTINVPSLRERLDDIPLLADFLLGELAAKNGIAKPSVNKTAMQLMQQYAWKGNVRELKNILERALVLQDNNEILTEHLPFEIQQSSASTNSISLSDVEKQHIKKILQSTGWNKAKAARLLQIGLATLYRKMEEYQIAPDLSK